MRNQEFQGGEVFEQVRSEALHKSCGVGIQIVRASRVEATVAAGAHVDHGGDVVFHHFFVDGVPVFVAQGRRCPVTARRIGVQVDTHIAILFHAALQLWNTGSGIHTWRLGQHGHRHKVVWEQLAHAVAQLVADGSPCGRHIEVANVVSHETGPGAEQSKVRAALFHEPELIGFNRLTQFVIADFEVSNFGA